jgi:hypothetical protein
VASHGRATTGQAYRNPLGTKPVAWLLSAPPRRRTLVSHAQGPLCHARRTAVPRARSNRPVGRRRAGAARTRPQQLEAGAQATLCPATTSQGLYRAPKRTPCVFGEHAPYPGRFAASNVSCCSSWSDQPLSHGGPARPRFNGSTARSRTARVARRASGAVRTAQQQAGRWRAAAGIHPMCSGASVQPPGPVCSRRQPRSRAKPASSWYRAVTVLKKRNLKKGPWASSTRPLGFTRPMPPCHWP